VIGLDTNVLVRYIVGDDPEQSARARRVVETLTQERPGFVSVVVLAELHWVLRRTYRVGADDAAAVVRDLLDAQEIIVAEADAVRRAHSRVREGVDFVDALVAEVADAAGCEYTATFDRQASRHPTMRLV
jgi:predicted nucleic-acid-binding protein